MHANDIDPWSRDGIIEGRQCGFFTPGAVLSKDELGFDRIAIKRWDQVIPNEFV
jgi:hypothetical protein